MMSHGTKWEYLKAVYPRYRRATRADKRTILDEFCETSHVACGARTPWPAGGRGPAAALGARLRVDPRRAPRSPRESIAEAGALCFGRVTAFHRSYDPLRLPDQGESERLRWDRSFLLTMPEVLVNS